MCSHLDGRNRRFGSGRPLSGSTCTMDEKYSIWGVYLCRCQCCRGVWGDARVVVCVRVLRLGKAVDQIELVLRERNVGAV